MSAFRSALAASLLLGIAPVRGETGSGQPPTTAAVTSQTGSANAQPTYLIGTLRISGPTIRLAPAGAAAATVDIENHGPGPDRLLSANIGSAAARIAIADEGGSGTTDPGGGVDLPSGRSISVTLSTDAPPGGWSEVPPAADHVGGLLTFERGGVLKVEFAIASATPPAP